MRRKQKGLCKCGSTKTYGFWLSYSEQKLKPKLRFVMDLAATNQISEAATAALELRASVSLVSRPVRLYCG